MTGYLATRPNEVMSEAVPSEIAEQVSQACKVIESHLAPELHAIHLYGSALDGGLRPLSDIDLLVTLQARLDESIRPQLLRDLLAVSAPPGENAALRPLEVTIVAHDEVVPWRYPAQRELQFGEWLRRDIQAGVFDRAVSDIDLTILLKKVRLHSAALMGASAEEVFDPVAEEDFIKALADTLEQWKSHADWKGDERNVILTLARIWYSAATGEIAPKDVAAGWALERLPGGCRPILHEARHAYLAGRNEGLDDRADEVSAFVHFAKPAIVDVLADRMPPP